MSSTRCAHTSMPPTTEPFPSQLARPAPLGVHHLLAHQHHHQEVPPGPQPRPRPSGPSQLAAGALQATRPTLLLRSSTGVTVHRLSRSSAAVCSSLSVVLLLFCYKKAHAGHDRLGFWP